MKKPIFYLLILFSLQTGFAQDTIVHLKAVDVKNIKIATILKKIKYELRENYSQENTDYFIKQFSIRDNIDTLVDRKNSKKLNLKTLDKRNLQLMLTGNKQDPFHNDTSSYFAYEPTVTEDHWLALSIYYDSMKVIDFDFFNTINYHYNYEIIKDDENSTTVKFSADRYYTGYFTYNNKNFHLIRIAFKNTKPYYYSVISMRSSEFISQWKYNNVTIKLDFKDDIHDKLFLDNLDAMQELTNFYCKRFDDQGKKISQFEDLSFYSTLSMRFIQ